MENSQPAALATSWWFIRHRLWHVFATLVTVLFPLVIGLIVLAAVGLQQIDTSILQNLAGNTYLTNNILILFIFVSYLIVLLSLGLYLVAIGQEAFRYRGKDGRPKVAVIIAFVLIVAVGLIVLVYMGMIVVGVITGWSKITFRSIIEWNKWVTVACFSGFVLIDLLIIYAKAIEQRSLKNELSKVKQDGGIPKLSKVRAVLHARNEIQFSKLSTWLISLPTICITAMTWWLVEFISVHPESFKAVHDVSLNIDVALGINDVNWFLFLDGIETGIIASSVTLSQMIYAVLKLRYHYQAYIIDEVSDERTLLTQDCE